MGSKRDLVVVAVCQCEN